MEKLFRIIPQKDWLQAQSSGFIPRCPSDQRENCIHVNVASDVEFVAGLYFSADQNPVALEIDVPQIVDKLDWKESTLEKPWQQACLAIDHLETGMITGIHALVAFSAEGKTRFRWPKNSPGPISVAQSVVKKTTARD